MTERTGTEPSSTRASGDSSGPGNDYYLGLDSSTQSLTAVLVDLERGEVVLQKSLRFDDRLPHWQTTNGQLENRDQAIGHAPPLMWVEALECLLLDLTCDGVDLSKVRGVAVSGQQHGSVYLRESFESLLHSADPGQPLWQQIGPGLSRETSPLWTDSSTSAECQQIRAQLGGISACAQLTGSDIFERFTGPQVRRFANTEPEAYEATCQIALVSSFMTSILLGRVAPIDWGDGSGMNLMDLNARSWSREACDATADALVSRLPPLVSPSTVLGCVAPYLVARFGFSPDCRIVVGSGDNPSSLVGVGAVEEGTAVISLGTSDTFFQLTAKQNTDPTGNSHVFVAPTGDAMALLCFRNGSLARERTCEHFGIDWDGFSRALRSTPPGNDGALILPWYEPEIVPRGALGPRTLGPIDLNDQRPESAPIHCRAVLEGQLLSMRLHSRFLDSAPQRLVVTGGGSSNLDIVRVVSDVFQCPAAVVETPDSAALGAAIRAAHACETRSDDRSLWRDLSRKLSCPVYEASPKINTGKVYDQQLLRLDVLVRTASNGVGNGVGNRVGNEATPPRAES